MNATALTLLYAMALLAGLALKFWLASRQIRHVAAHRDHVPAPFAGAVTLEAHRRAADYTIAKARFGMLSMAIGSAVLLGWTLLGGLDALNSALATHVLPLMPGAAGALTYQLALFVAFALIGSLVDVPLELYSTFRIEQRFGFNRTTKALYAADWLKGMAVSALLGLPLAALVLWLMAAAGPSWWVWAWAVWTAFMVLMMVAYPVLIAPWFNRFEPLADAAVRTRVEALMARCGFAAKGLFVMDGSRRSAHGNAYFTGLGRSKRVVFFDTLLARLTPPEIEAVLAHELGHFKHRHVSKRLVMMVAFSGAGFALLGTLSGATWFYEGLGVTPLLGAPNDAVALILFALVLPVFSVFVTPLFARLSRRDEFQADAYACAHADGRQLAAALLKLHEDNAATLTPDPVYARFYYSHPPATERLAALPSASLLQGHDPLPA